MQNQQLSACRQRASQPRPNYSRERIIVGMECGLLLLQCDEILDLEAVRHLADRARPSRLTALALTVGAQDGIGRNPFGLTFRKLYDA
jgi:hypothetical protein